MRIRCIPLGPLETNCFALDNGQEAIVLDPGGDPGPVIAHLNRNKLRLTAVYDTHLHFDHILGNAGLADATSARIYANKQDEYLLQPDAVMWGMPPVPPFTYTPQEAASCTLLGRRCRILHTPGHTPGSLSFYWPDDAAVFVGDVLFYRSVGRTDLPGGNGLDLRRSIQDILFRLPPYTTVYPGHGPNTTIGDEAEHNPYYRMA